MHIPINSLTKSRLCPSTLFIFVEMWLKFHWVLGFLLKMSWRRLKMEKGEEICAFWLTKHSSPARALRTGNASLATHEPGTQVPLLPLAASRNAAQSCYLAQAYSGVRQILRCTLHQNTIVMLVYILHNLLTLQNIRKQ